MMILEIIRIMNWLRIGLIILEFSRNLKEKIPRVLD